jgi:hypothetical protein
MSERRVLLYFAWSRPDETEAPLEVINNRFPALFESRRMLYPRYEAFSDIDVFDQGIAGFLDYIQKPNFVGFTEFAENLTRSAVTVVERVGGDGQRNVLNDALLKDFDTLIIISLDSLYSEQTPSADEVRTAQRFLSNPDHVAFVCPHHDIGSVDGLVPHTHSARQLEEFHHHGDRTIPPQQRFSSFSRTLLEALGVPVENQFGLHPRLTDGGSSWPFDANKSHDRLQLLQGVESFNTHPHLPHLERLGASTTKLDVLVKQEIDPNAPPHPFTQRASKFDSLLQSGSDVFPGTLLVCDATLWSSTQGGLPQLHQFWTNVLRRPARS